VKLSKLKIQNYRLLEDFSLDLSDDLSLVIGKNNTGKTSILNVLDGFLNKGAKFSFEDFSFSFKNRLKAKVEDAHKIAEEDYISEGVSLTLFIDYKDGDDISQVSKVMMDLDPENNTVVLRLDYSLDYQKFRQLGTDYREFAAKEVAKHDAKPSYKK
jgi:predicted ATP-dependent endonuclease of OLD family